MILATLFAISTVFTYAALFALNRRREENSGRIRSVRLDIDELVVNHRRLRESLADTRHRLSRLNEDIDDLKVWAHKIQASGKKRKNKTA